MKYKKYNLSNITKKLFPLCYGYWQQQLEIKQKVGGKKSKQSIGVNTIK